MVGLRCAFGEVALLGWVWWCLWGLVVAGGCWCFSCGCLYIVVVVKWFGFWLRRASVGVIFGGLGFM